jgi:CHAT domain-containing protein
MLCRSAVQDFTPYSTAGLILGDPDTHDAAAQMQAPSLPAARLEASVIAETFYPEACYLGRYPDGMTSKSGAGTAAQLRSWLTEPDPVGGAVLHLACHGTAGSLTEPGSSSLVLAEGELLTAGEILELLTNQPDRRIGLVVLAACHTGQALEYYDEAVSLATSFLAAGARSVVSTQWSVADSATAIMMFVFHYLRCTRGLHAWEALREAQLWMLDPNRVVPEAMPDALRRVVGHWDLINVANWAAFIHMGR